MVGNNHCDDWDEDEPPVLGEGEGPAVDSQLAEQTQELSIMDEMLEVAQRAKEDKKRQQDMDRNRKSFGQGLKKGFFNTTGSSQKKKVTPAQRSTTLEAGQQQSPAESLMIVKQNQEEEVATNSTFVFSEVQEAMKSMNQIDPKEWMNERFFEKLARNPKLAQALRNPLFSKAIAEMQQDPRAAIMKYQKDQAVSAMLRDFMEFLGSHFEELGASSHEKINSQEQQRLQSSPQANPISDTPKPPKIVDLDETRRQAIAKMQRTPEEEKQVQDILKNPELLAALSDGNLMQQLHSCQQSPGELQRLVQDPVLGPKLRLLIQHNMVQFA